MESLASKIAVLSAGVFFLVGLVCGAWKYLHISRSEDATAPVYVDIAHRAALMYAFACLLIERFVVLSKLGANIETAAVLAQVVFFALAVFAYIVHGLLRDTNNQLARPHRLGAATLPNAMMTTFMLALIAGEIGGFAVLLWGSVM